MIFDILRQTIMITSLVLVMMLIIEYINVVSQGKWGENLSKSKYKQIFVAALLGLVPGCVGSFAVVSLYTHQVIGFGALVANMIASSGDESFVMFSLFPATAIKLNILILGIALVAGFIINYFVKANFLQVPSKPHLVIHEHEVEKQSRSFSQALRDLKNISFPRAVLLMGLLMFILGIFTGQFEHGVFSGQGTVNPSHSNGSDGHWEESVFVLVSLIALYLIIIVEDHFLQEHLWEHIIKKHFLKIFLWTFGALLVIHFMMTYIDIEHWMKANVYILLVIAVLVGIIPESGPNLVFVIFFFNGALPFSILLANSIVQDGHGALPLLAESKKSFLYMKITNMIIAFAVGLVGLWINL